MKWIPKKLSSLWLSLAFAVLFILTQVFNAVGWNFLIPAFAVISFLCGLLGFVFAVRHFINGERALLIYLPMILGIFIIIFIVGEAFTPSNISS